MPATTEEQLKSIFEDLINMSDDSEDDSKDLAFVERVKKNKDHAFIHFSTREAAEKVESLCKLRLQTFRVLSPF